MLKVLEPHAQIWAIFREACDINCCFFQCMCKSAASRSCAAALINIDKSREAFYEASVPSIILLYAVHQQHAVQILSEDFKNNNFHANLTSIFWCETSGVIS